MPHHSDELMVHSDAATTMTYTRALSLVGGAVRRPLDVPPENPAL